MSARFLIATTLVFLYVVRAVSAGEEEHMSDLQTLLERNGQFTANYNGGMNIVPKFSTFILTCVDARVDPAHFLGLELGDALVFRNAGGRVTDDLMLDLGILWSLVARMSGEDFRGFSLALIQHTDCGFERLANSEMAAALGKRLGAEQVQIDSLANLDHVRSIHKDIEHLRKSPLVPKGLIVSGHIYHVENGTIEEVVAPAALE
jgi:carbonic anhydrase